ncbi:uracil-DNA glycosylase [candidate division KSB1 bacterium]|nr:uracil-DNA glycosylase [candidate division KSB1 bacterium]
MTVRKEQLRSHLEYLSLFETELPWPSANPTVRSQRDPRELRVLPGAGEPLPRSLAEYEQAICNCQRCALGATRTKFVFADGNPRARIVFVGEAPGHDEDLQGLPFVGRAGQLLNQLLAGVGLSRKDVYICNVLKCRPPGNRDPQPVEVATCRPYLMTQLSILNPDLLVCLGRHAAMALLQTDAVMRDLRGRVIPWHGLQILVTYHPAYFLRSMNQLYLGEQDFRKLRELYDALPA